MADRPNLVFVFADQLRTQSCGYAGDRYERGVYADNPEPHTPNIDRLAEQSLDFREAVAVNPICCPYRASLFTGKYPSSTGMVINELRAMPDPDAIGHVLGEHGYRTSYLGKWHMYGKDHSPPQQFVPPGPYRQGFDEEWKAYNFNHDYYDGFYYEDTFDRIAISGYQPHTFTDVALHALRRYREQERPFALFLSYGPPHDPWTWDNVPDPFAHLFREAEFPDPPNYTDGHARYWHPEWGEEWWLENWKPHRHRQRRVYAAHTASLDWEVGRLLYALRKLGLEEDTLLVFTSDHGEMFGSHGRIAKKIFYEEAARVPFLLRWPGEIAPRTTDACLNTPDIAPTILQLMGLPVPDSMEGRNLSAVARGYEEPSREPVLLQGMGHTFQWHNGDEWRAARDDQYVYATMLEGEEYLFDHRNDPYQLDNLVHDSDYQDVKERLRRWMNEKMDALNDPFQPTTWYRNRWIKDRVILRSATRELEPRFRPHHLKEA